MLQNGNKIVNEVSFFLIHETTYVFMNSKLHKVFKNIFMLLSFKKVVAETVVRTCTTD
jgi:hypothetical protein